MESRGQMPFFVPRAMIRRNKSSLLSTWPLDWSCAAITGQDARSIGSLILSGERSDVGVGRLLTQAVHVSATGATGSRLRW
jgi:hypothetical protein